MLVGYARHHRRGHAGNRIQTHHSSRAWKHAFQVAVVILTLLGACAAWMLAVPGVRPQSYFHARVSGGGDHLLRESKT
jgi:hypothetical protein